MKSWAFLFVSIIFSATSHAASNKITDHCVESKTGIATLEEYYGRFEYKDVYVLNKRLGIFYKRTKDGIVESFALNLLQVDESFIKLNADVYGVLEDKNVNAFRMYISVMQTKQGKFVQSAGPHGNYITSDLEQPVQIADSLFVCYVSRD